MARSNRMSVQKRKREREKAEKAAIKRERRFQKPPEDDEREDAVATRSDLEGYGVIPTPDDEEEATSG